MVDCKNNLFEEKIDSEEIDVSEKFTHIHLKDEYRIDILYLRHQIDSIKKVITMCKSNQNFYLSKKMKELVLRLLSFVNSQAPNLLKKRDFGVFSYCYSNQSCIKVEERPIIVDTLNTCLNHLENVISTIKLRDSNEVFLYIIDGYVISKPFSKYLFEVALLVQTAVKVGAKKIEAFGELDENSSEKN
jgi:hypothetical protein